MSFPGWLQTQALSLSWDIQFGGRGSISALPIKQSNPQKAQLIRWFRKQNKFCYSALECVKKINTAQGDKKEDVKNYFNFK